jgi:hypothetical protein
MPLSVAAQNATRNPFVASKALMGSRGSRPFLKPQPVILSDHAQGIYHPRSRKRRGMDLSLWQPARQPRLLPVRHERERGRASRPGLDESLCVRPLWENNPARHPRNHWTEPGAENAGLAIRSFSEIALPNAGLFHTNWTRVTSSTTRAIGNDSWTRCWRYEMFPFNEMI